MKVKIILSEEFLRHFKRLAKKCCAAKVKGLTMVTDNVRHFGRIEGVVVENRVKR